MDMFSSEQVPAYQMMPILLVVINHHYYPARFFMSLLQRLLDTRFLSV